jgi:choline dehydrogenase-like flavoprotein
MSTPPVAERRFDYIVVGAGAGGAVVAARLAQSDPNVRVLVIEAGSDSSAELDTAPAVEVSQAPSFHALATEHADLSWRFFVQHYADPPDGPGLPAGPDPKARAEDGRIFYPRAAALGGCTVHNAMITITGADADWDDLAVFLRDDSWKSEYMRAYFQRLERNDYSGRPRPASMPRTKRLFYYTLWLLTGRDPDPTRGRHGFDGWLHTSLSDVRLGLRDWQLVKMLKAALRQARSAGLERTFTLIKTFLRGRFRAALDPNHAETQALSPEGVVLIPLAVCGPRTTIHRTAASPAVRRGRRSGPRELLLETRAALPQQLEIWTDCLVTRVLFDASSGVARATGVELQRGKALYRAHANPSPRDGTREVVSAAREVILCGGAFNTPQLLMLSGVGDRDELQRFGIHCISHLPGVGKNLQDRYEVTLISQMRQRFRLLEGADFRLPGSATPDRHLREWRAAGTGLYTSNGSVLGILKRSRPELEQPDLFIFGLPLPFEGYELGYSDVGQQHDFFTWAILKADTRNHGGVVALESPDPRDVPRIDFHYFGSKGARDSRDERIRCDPDLLALVEGVKFVRGIAARAGSAVRGEHHPGFDRVKPGNDEQIKDWILREAWGHHACGTCRMGPDNDPAAVLDSRLRVRGTVGLRVVDASIFPKIPGYFIVSNIYMAAEKAADVIREDAERSEPQSYLYPDALRRAEADAIRRRREQRFGEGAAAAMLRAPPGAWADDVTGLGLSGGGIRSATFNLGVLQALARPGLLGRMDFLSTVSGGGYVGSFLGRLYDRLRELPISGHQLKAASDRADRALLEQGAAEILWLRRSGNYIAPSGPGDARLDLATFLRNLLTMHLVVGTLLFAVFGIANGLRYFLAPAEQFLALAGLDGRSLPIGWLLDKVLGPFFSPWFVLMELLVILLVVPRAVGFWLASPRHHERYDPLVLCLVLAAAAALLWLGVREGLAAGPLALGLSLLLAFLHVELAWHRGKARSAAIGTGGEANQRLRTRNYLTYDLGLGLAIAAGALGFALIDTLAHGIYRVMIEEHARMPELAGAYGAAFAGLFGAVAAVIPIGRYLARLLAERGSEGPPSTLRRLARSSVPIGVLALVLFAAPLTLYSFAAHAVYQGGAALRQGAAATVFGLLATLVIAFQTSLAFVNNTSMAGAYGARLARAFLGASNPARRRREGSNLTEVMPGDDVESIRQYRPHEAGGPLHLINITVNQTVDFTSQRGNRDRKGENLAVSALGMSIGERWHALWADSRGRGPDDAPPEPHHVRLEAIRPPGGEHPLVDETGAPADRAETLSLRQWIAISGAAVGPGRGQATQLGTALLFGLAGLRTGYWWNSGITEAARDGFPRLTPVRRLLYLLPRLLTPQALFLYEWIARYPGPWERYWHLSDGGFFENLGGYELIRRRVPRIVLCDASADPSYRFDDLANLIRKVRIDFGAEIRPLSDDELAALQLPNEARASLGGLEQLRPACDETGRFVGPATRRAALFRVRYGAEPRGSWLLYLKATVPPDASPDVRNYHASHPEFPHESTGDQFFDEEQWESHRRLGEELGRSVFPDGWFWRLPLPRTEGGVHA